MFHMLSVASNQLQAVGCSLLNVVFTWIQDVSML